jgi:hypothetical protein
MREMEESGLRTAHATNARADYDASAAAALERSGGLRADRRRRVHALEIVLRQSGIVTGSV